MLTFDAPLCITSNTGSEPNITKYFCCLPRKPISQVITRDTTVNKLLSTECEGLPFPCISILELAAMEELGPSELGTLEYWENRYQDEINNFSHHGDPGEVWFGEDIVDRIVTWISKNVNKNFSVVDVGCGNGHILVELANEGYTNLTGLDYSPNAVDLAKTVAEKQGLQIKYDMCNVLEGLRDKYDVIHDKGTYDAISLSENSKDNRNKYIICIENALKENGYFIITSCNWTQQELEDQYKNNFILHRIIPTPQFKFGGKVGNVVSICVFRKQA